MKILVHTPISNRAWALPTWWAALHHQTYPHDQIDLRFDVNDCQDQTLTLLREYEKSLHGFRFWIMERDWNPLLMEDHRWNPERYRRMRLMRNEALRAAEEGDYDFMLSLDSDVILSDPDTISHFVGTEVPILAGVFMAKWGNPDAVALPNVWQRGQNEMTEEFREVISRARRHVRVGGLGACVLIRRDVIEAGVTFDPVYNLPSDYRGEDRDFCVRAVVAGFDLLACAHQRIIHIDRIKEAVV